MTRRHFDTDLGELVECQELRRVPIGSQGVIKCHYIDHDGVTVQEVMIASTKPLEAILAQQEKVRAGLERLGESLGYTVLSIQVVFIGSEKVRLPNGRSLRRGEVLNFPGTARMPDSAPDRPRQAGCCCDG